MKRGNNQGFMVWDTCKCVSIDAIVQTNVMSCFDTAPFVIELLQLSVTIDRSVSFELSYKYTIWYIWLNLKKKKSYLVKVVHPILSYWKSDMSELVKKWKPKVVWLLRATLMSIQKVTLLFLIEKEAIDKLSQTIKSTQTSVWICFKSNGPYF